MTYLAAPITQECLKSLLEYSSETGLFTWVGTKARRISNGDIAGAIAKRRRNTYIQICVCYKPLYAHQLAWLYIYGYWPAEIDHVDGDGTNNKLNNLRLCTSSQNKGNSRIRVDNTSGFKGVHWVDHCSKWRASIQHNRRSMYLGLFDTAEQAHAVYAAKALNMFGEFARPV